MRAYCKYCDLLSGCANALTSNKILLIAMHNGTYSLQADNIQDDYDEVDINYCPMCGRKLGE